MATQMTSFEEALSMAIFAINTLLYPEGSSQGDINALEIIGDDVIATLVEIRDIVGGRLDA